MTIIISEVYSTHPESFVNTGSALTYALLEPFENRHTSHLLFFPPLFIYNCTALVRITTALSFTSPYRTSTECTHMSALISLSAAAHTSQRTSLRRKICPLLSSLHLSDSVPSIDWHSQEEDGGREYSQASVFA